MLTRHMLQHTSIYSDILQPCVWVTEFPSWCDLQLPPVLWEGRVLLSPFLDFGSNQVRTIEWGSEASVPVLKPHPKVFLSGTPATDMRTFFSSLVQRSWDTCRVEPLQMKPVIQMKPVSISQPPSDPPELGQELSIACCWDFSIVYWPTPF